MSPSPPGFPRRRLLAGTAGLALVLAGCTPGGAGEAAAQEEDRLAGQVAVQEAVVAAYAAAGAADPGLGGTVTGLALQAREQLDRLRAAAPGTVPSSAASSSAVPVPPAGGDVRTWLREQLGAAAAAHAAACVDTSGAGAALLGSVAAGLRGQSVALA